MAKRLANKGRRSVPKTTELGRRCYDTHKDKIVEYQKRIIEDDYVDFAINKIALELTHFLLK